MNEIHVTRAVGGATTLGIIDSRKPRNLKRFRARRVRQLSVRTDLAPTSVPRPNQLANFTGVIEGQRSYP